MAEAQPEQTLPPVAAAPAAQEPEPKITELSFEEVQEGLKNGSIILVDVRGKEELQIQGEIPNSTNIPLPELQDFLHMLSEEEFNTRFGFSLVTNKPSDKLIVFSCRSGKRAEAAIESIHARVKREMEKNGETCDDVTIRPDIRLYRGSFLNWLEKGGEIIGPK